MTIYELSTEYAAILAEYDAAEDDAQRAELLEILNALQDDINAKGEAYARAIKNMAAERDALKAEAKRLTDMANAKDSAITRMKEQLLVGMNTAGVTELHTSIGKWRVQRNPWSVNVVDADKVPAKYHVPQPDKIDKAAILREFKATGEVVNGVDMRQDTGVRFR